MAKKKTVVTPGETLKSWLDEYQVSITQAAGDIQLSVSAVRQIITNKAKISIHIAKRLSKYFNTTVEYWMDLQNAYTLAELEHDAELTEILKNIPRAKKSEELPVKPKKTAEPESPKKPKKEAKTKAASPKKPRAKKEKPLQAAAEKKEAPPKPRKQPRTKKEKAPQEADPQVFDQ